MSCSQILKFPYSGAVLYFTYVLFYMLIVNYLVGDTTLMNWLSDHLKSRAQYSALKNRLSYVENQSNLYKISNQKD